MMKYSEVAHLNVDKHKLMPYELRLLIAKAKKKYPKHDLRFISATKELDKIVKELCAKTKQLQKKQQIHLLVQTGELFQRLYAKTPYHTHTFLISIEANKQGELQAFVLDASGNISAIAYVGILNAHKATVYLSMGGIQHSQTGCNVFGLNHLLQILKIDDLFLLLKQNCYENLGEHNNIKRIDIKFFLGKLAILLKNTQSLSFFKTFFKKHPECKKTVINKTGITLDAYRKLHTVEQRNQAMEYKHQKYKKQCTEPAMQTDINALFKENILDYASKENGLPWHTQWFNDLMGFLKSEPSFKDKHGYKMLQDILLEKPQKHTTLELATAYHKAIVEDLANDEEHPRNFYAGKDVLKAIPLAFRLNRYLEVIEYYETRPQPKAAASKFYNFMLLNQAEIYRSRFFSAAIFLEKYISMPNIAKIDEVMAALKQRKMQEPKLVAWYNEITKWRQYTVPLFIIERLSFLTKKIDRYINNVLITWETIIKEVKYFKEYNCLGEIPLFDMTLRLPKKYRSGIVLGLLRGDYNWVLRCAAMFGLKNIVVVMLQRKQELNINIKSKSRSGFTAYELAKKNNKFEIVKLLS